MTYTTSKQTHGSDSATSSTADAASAHESRAAYFFRRPTPIGHHSGTQTGLTTWRRSSIIGGS